MLPHVINAKPNIICINLIQPHGWNSFLTNFVLFIYFLPGMGGGGNQVEQSVLFIKQQAASMLWCWLACADSDYFGQNNHTITCLEFLGHLNCGTDLGNRWILIKPLSRWPTNSRHVIVLSKIIWISVLLQLE